MDHKFWDEDVTKQNGDFTSSSFMGHYHVPCINDSTLLERETGLDQPAMQVPTNRISRALPLELTQEGSDAHERPRYRLSDTEAVRIRQAAQGAFEVEIEALLLEEAEHELQVEVDQQTRRAEEEEARKARADREQALASKRRAGYERQPTREGGTRA